MLKPYSPVALLPDRESSREHSIDRVEPIAAPPFETASGTILKLESPLLADLKEPAALSGATVSAMQHLVETVQRLRQQSSGYFSSKATSEMLVPYVSEEAYDVLDTIFSRSAEAVEPNIRDSRATPPLPLSSLVTIQSLIPNLIWCIARSSYTLMQLIEGIPARCCQPKQPWTAGMLRLVIMLEMTAKTSHWCFDIATASRPESLLDGNQLIQADQQLLPSQHSATAAVITETGEYRNRASQVECQIEELLRQIDAATPALKPFLDGLTLEVFQPGQDWERGRVQLKVGLEFTAVENGTSTQEDPIARSIDHVEPPNDETDLESILLQPVEEALGVPIAETDEVTSFEGTVHRAAADIPTLVRVVDSTTLTQQSHLAMQRRLEGIVARLQHQTDDHSQDALLSIVQAACEASDRPHVSDFGIGLLQPELLMDEVVPKLLWQVTRCGYSVMQLIGGVEAQVLQPGCHWQQGTVRLAAVLRIISKDIHRQLDLSTGEVVGDLMTLDARAIVQSKTIPLCQQPIQVAVLSSYVLRLSQETTPELGLLIHGIPVEWLETDQEWYAGTLCLSLELEFIPNSSSSEA